MSNIREKLTEAGVWRAEHVQLASGRHSDVTLEMNALATDHSALAVVFRELAATLFENKDEVVVPISPSLPYLIGKTFPLKLPQMVSPSASEEGAITFEDEPWKQRFIQNASRLAILEDVTTDGRRALAVAMAARAINSEVELDLVSICRRDELPPEIYETFRTQTFLVDEPIDSWPAEDCLQCPTY